MTGNIIENTDNSGGQIIQTTIINRVNLHSIFRSLFLSIKVSVGKLISEPIELTELAQQFFTGSIDANQVVKVKGFLSQHGLLTKPLTFHTPINAVGRVVTNNNRHQKKKLSPISQIPVQILPPLYDTEIGWYKVVFLYPSNFDTFILPIDGEKEKEKNPNDYLLINEDVKGIPVLMPADFDESFLEQYVIITGVIGSASTNIAEKLIPYFDETVLALNGNFYRPYSRRPEGLCLDCRVRGHYDIKGVRLIETLPASLYVEGHIDSVIEEVVSDIALECSYSLTGNPMSVGFASTTQDKEMNVVTDDNFIVKSSPPNIFGFYTETDLANKAQLQDDYRDMQRKWRTFSERSNIL